MSIRPEDIPLPPSPPATIITSAPPSPSSPATTITSAPPIPILQIDTSIDTMSNDQQHPMRTDSAAEIKPLCPESFPFDLWSPVIRAYLLENSLLKIVLGTEVAPTGDTTTDADRRSFEARKMRAAGFLTRKLSAPIRSLLVTTEIEEDPVAIWTAIQGHFASTKARNRARVLRKFLHHNCHDGHLAEHINGFRSLANEMKSVGVKIEDDIMAHICLHKLSPAYHPTRDIMAQMAESSDTALTLTGVLSNLHQLVLDEPTAPLARVPAALVAAHDRRTYARCTNGRHNPQATGHGADTCYQEHPELRPARNGTNSTRGRTAASTTLSGTVLSSFVLNTTISGRPVLDSGASQTMFADRNAFVSYDPFSATISVANGQQISAVGRGDITLNHGGESVTLTNCLHVPALRTNLVSMVDLVNKGCKVDVDSSGDFSVSSNSGAKVLSGSSASGVLELNVKIGA